jgi:dsDNA-specific endonuclease/ATPase MutS2
MSREASQNQGVNSEGSKMDASVDLPIEDTIDLHPFLPREIADLIEEYLYQAVLKGYREVRIIHGRGIGVQRSIVHSVLQKHPRVVYYRDEMDHGSTVVMLKQD